jgi:hypothetical protein
MEFSWTLETDQLEINVENVEVRFSVWNGHFWFETILVSEIAEQYAIYNSHTIVDSKDGSIKIKVFKSRDGSVTLLGIQAIEILFEQLREISNEYKVLEFWWLIITSTW